MCFLCGTVALITSTKYPYFPVTKFDCEFSYKNSSEAASSVGGATVLEKMYHVFELPAADALYNQMCNMHFRASKGITLKYTILSSLERRSNRRHILLNRSTSFYKVNFQMIGIITFSLKTAHLY